MRAMSEETELRMCDEDFGSEEEEGDAESYLEDNSSELMDRLRELEVATGFLHSTGPSFPVHLHHNQAAVSLCRRKTRL